jgi:hypothetical protein
MKICNRRLKWMAVGLSSFFAILLVVGAEELPTLRDLASNIVKTMPTNHYRVDVSQINEASLTNSVGVKGNSHGISAQANTNRSTYQLHYSHKNGIHTEVVSQPQGTNVSNAVFSPAANLRVSVNISAFLEKIQSWPTNAIIKDVWNGQSCYKLSASTKNGSTEVWVDAESKCVLRVILDIQGSRFSESILKYRLDKQNGWLLASVDMSFAADGSRVRLEYGDYDFSQP